MEDRRVRGPADPLRRHRSDQVRGQRTDRRGVPGAPQEGRRLQVRAGTDAHAEHEGGHRLLPLLRLAERHGEEDRREHLSQVQDEGSHLMATGSSIEWTEATWNPVTGCDKISPGCKHCYAERMAGRLRAMGQANYKNGFKLTLQPHMLDLPLRWKKPTTIFVNSMSDLFHKDVPLDFIRRAFAVMRKAHWHRFQVLTKRADRVSQLDPDLTWPPNVWMGTSVESAKYASRIDDLRKTRARVRFLSL